MELLRFQQRVYELDSLILMKDEIEMTAHTARRRAVAQRCTRRPAGAHRCSIELDI